MKGYTTGDKLYKLRTELGLKQEDLESEHVSKGLIEMIEKNKRNLTWDTAKVIAKCLNNYYTSLEKEITASFLMDSEYDEVKKHIKEELDSLQSLIQAGNVEETKVHESFDKIMDLVTEWGFMEEMYELKVMRGRYYNKIYQYPNALADYFEALEYYIDVKNFEQVARLYNFIGVCYYWQMRINEALMYYARAFDIAITHNTPNKDQMKMEATFNQILCYRKLNQYDVVLQYIDTFRNLRWDDVSYFTAYTQVSLIEGNTFRDMGFYSKAERIYSKLLDIPESIHVNTTFLVYENYTTLYRLQGKIDTALAYLSKAFSLAEKLEQDYHLPSLYFQQAKCHMILKQYDEVIENLENGLIVAELVSRVDRLIEINLAFVEVYILLRDYPVALRYLKKVEKILSKHGTFCLKYDINSYYRELYFVMGEKEKCLEYILKDRRNILSS